MTFSLQLLRQARQWLLQWPGADRRFREALAFFRQWPWVRPRGVVASARGYLEAESRRRSWFQRRRGGWYRPIYPEAVRICHPPQDSAAPLPAQFRAEVVRTIPEAGLYYFPGAYLFSDQGAVLSGDNRLFDEFAHHFGTVPLRNGPYFRPFATFARTVERNSGWVALLAAPEGRNHYHWLFDVLPRLHLLEPMRAHIESYALPADLNAVQREGLDLLGIAPAQILTLQPRSKLYCERLLVPSLAGSEGSVPDWSVRFLRETFLGRLPREEPDAGQRKIYLSRQQTTARPVVDEERVMEIMRGRGFEIIVPERLSFLEQVAIFARAKQVVGAHGAAFSNLVFSEHVRVLEIFSPDYLRPDCYYTLADQCGHRYWYLVGRSPMDKPSSPWGSVEVDPDALQRLLDRIESAP